MKICQGYSGTGMELLKYLGRVVCMAFSYHTLSLKNNRIRLKKKKSWLAVIVHFSSSVFIGVYNSYFYLKKYLPQTLGSVVNILFSFFDISESDPSPKGEFSRPQKQVLIMDTTWK